ncbi:MAG: phosphatase PAP2 family protein [Prevotellaceae bacterium]|nr:phosphatase PAP2 family protein [Prevotellaceae bacterium]
MNISTEEKSILAFKNNGFDASKGVNEKAYLKENNVSFAVLHYPSTVDADNLAKYTDPTRVYTLEDNTHATDTKGNLLHWPSQAEWNHAYITAYTGYTWGAWDKSKTTWSFANCTETTDQNGNVTVTPDVSGVLTDKTKTYDKDYTGWHQFILANMMDSEKEKEDPVRNFSRFKQNDWYTICVPYNIKKSDLQKIFGVTADDAATATVKMADGTTKEVPSTGLYPDVVTLTVVKRDATTNTITLQFSKNLINQDVTMIAHRCNLGEQIIVTTISIAMQESSVTFLKNNTHVQRPDLSAHNSFPSGHTTMAFVGAELLYQEYGATSSLIGIIGYLIAACTGFLRMYNNRHWLTDVVAGAGLGILIVRFAYWLLPRIMKKIREMKSQKIRCVSEKNM